MAATPVPVNTIVRAGIAEAANVTGNAVDGHTMVNNGETFLRVENTGVTSRTLTVTLTTQKDGVTLTGTKVYTFASSETRYAGPFPVSSYGTTLVFTVSHAELVMAAYTVSSQ